MSRPKKQAEQTDPRYREKLRSVRRQLREIARDLWQNEWIVKAGLAASGIQLAIAFSYAHWLSWPGAVMKAAFIEACVWNLNKAIGWARLVKLSRAWLAFLWAVLAVVMLISTQANLYYEYEKKLANKLPRGTRVVVSQETINRHMDFDEKIDAWQRSGLIPLLVLAMIAARRVLGDAATGFDREETGKTKKQLRDAAYRARKKQEKERLK
jgi:hypothetical protein